MTQRRIRAFALVFFLISGSAFSKITHWDYVRIPIKQITADFIATTGFIRDHKDDDQFAFGYVKQGSAARLSSAELTFLDESEWRHFDHDAKTLKRVAAKNGVAREDFHTYETLTAELKKIAAETPVLSSLESAGKSVDGRDLWYVRLSETTNKDPNKPKLLFVSSMHGDEVVGKELMVYLVRYLVAKFGSEDRITNLIKYADIFIMPSMNPDGTVRKQRWNANGEDLNRNFPQIDEEEFSTAGREPETVALMELHRNNHFVLSMNFHGGNLCVNIPWDSKSNPPNARFGDDRLTLSLANQYATQNSPMYNHDVATFTHGVTYGWEWYEVAGGMQDWSDFFRQSTHVTTELWKTKWPASSQLAKAWEDNRESLIGYLESGLLGYHYKVVNEAGQLLPVKIEMDSATRPLSFESGFTHRAALSENQSVTLSSPGYATQRIAAAPWSFRGDYKTITMKK